MKRGWAAIMLVAASLCFSLGGVLIKGIDWNPVAIAGARSGIAAVVVYLAFPRMRITWSNYQVGGAVAFAANMVLFVTANKLTAAANAVVLQYTAPAWIALFSAWFLRERIRKSDWVVIVIVSGGMFLFFMDRLTPGVTWGNLLALGSGLSYAWVFLFFRRQKDLDPYGSLFLGNLLTLFICLPFMFRGSLGTKSIVGLLLLGIIQIGAAYILYSMAIRHVTALDASIILLLEPILNPVWTFLALHEIPGPWAIFGCAIILLAITFQTGAPYLRERKKRSLPLEV